EVKYKINALHKMIGSDEMAEIPLELESAGTLKMFALYPELQEVLEKGSVFFIDELNACLHPLLVRNFLLTFLNPEINTNHAQLVFTTHDSYRISCCDVMKSGLLKRMKEVYLHCTHWQIS
ncbi:MAG: ATP/GTP-binding protein, partial [Acetatifactor sp.]